MDQSERLERYLEGEMNVEEREDFEREMAADPELALQVRLHRRLDMSLGNREEIEVENKLKGLMEEEVAEEPAQRRISYRPYLAVAAGIVLLALIGYFLLPQSVPPQELYAEHYFPYDGSGELRSGDSVPPTLWTQAFDLYDAGQFSEARAAFEEVTDVSPGNPRATFYIGQCHMELGEPALARKAFEEVLAEGQNLYLSQSQWYLAMACLKLEDIACVEAQLEPLSREAGAYKEAAEKVLHDL